MPTIVIVKPKIHCSFIALILILFELASIYHSLAVHLVASAAAPDYPLLCCALSPAVLQATLNSGRKARSAGLRFSRIQMGPMGEPFRRSNELEGPVRTGPVAIGSRNPF